MQKFQELLGIDAVLEGFAAVDEEDGNFVVKALAQIRVLIDVHLAKSESNFSPELAKQIFGLLA
jgi:hypothetical protein